MAYTPTLWAKGDKVTSEKLNKIEQGIVDKVDKETGKTLSTNDFTDAYKTKLDGIDANADKTTIDATLTNSGAAADAKATGDAIKDIENDLDGKVAIIESNLDEKVENLRSLVGTPLKATTASDMTDTSKIYVYTGNESGYTNGDWYYHDGSAWVDGGTYNSVAVEVDDTLTVNGMPADAKVVGDEIGSIKEDLNRISGISDEIKAALLQIAQKVVYVDADGQNYYNDLYDALFAITAISLNANSLSLGVGETFQLTATTTPSGGVVTWISSDTSVATVNNGLVTAVANGTATITASAGNVSAVCSVTISQATLSSISAVYTQSGTVYDTDSLDSLKANLVVTAHYSNQTTATVNDYTLSGTLSAGTSTITVGYSGKSTTFTVIVTAEVYTWRYSASSGDKFSEMSGITMKKTDKTCIEELTNDGLQITVPPGSKEVSYAWNPSTNINAKIKMRLMYKSIQYATAPNNLVLMLSDGSAGARVGASDNGASIYNFITIEGNRLQDHMVNVSRIELDTWYVVEVVKTGSNIKIIIDGIELYNSNNPATYFTTQNKILVKGNSASSTPDGYVQQSIIVVIDYVEYYNKD